MAIFTFPKIVNPNEDVTVDLPEINAENKGIIIISGGLDSTILTNLLAHTTSPDNLIAISFDYNQRHKVELERAKKTCEDLGIAHNIIQLHFFSEIVKNVSALSGCKVVDVPDMKDVEDHSQPPTYVPFRNTLFLTLAASVAESNNCKYIFIGAQAGDLYGYWDCSPEYMEQFNKLISLNHKNPIQLYAPFVNLTKADEIVIGDALNVDFANTHTCYRGVDEQGRSCGTCPTCIERLNNFKAAGLLDPLPYI